MGKLTFQESGVVPGTPPTGYVVFYAKTDGQLYYKDDAGIEYTVKGGASLADLDTLAKMNANFTDGTVLVDTADILLKAGGEMSGNITMAGAQTVDGRDLSVDGTKLDGIEALADVTDATNVAAAGAVMDSDISEAEGFLRKTGAGAYEALKSNLAASAAPTATDDSVAGYAVGSIWIDTTNDTPYTCVDATASAAVWSSGGGSGGLSWSTTNASSSPVAFDGVVYRSLTGGVTATLPTSASLGDMIHIVNNDHQYDVTITGATNCGFQYGNVVDLTTTTLGPETDAMLVCSNATPPLEWQVHRSNDAAGGGGGGGLTVEFKTASFTAVAGKKYKVDTSGGAVTVTLPAGTNLDNIVIQDVGHVAGTNNITVNPDGSETIDGDTTFVIDQHDGDIDIGYNSSTTDWEISADGSPDIVNVLDYVMETGTFTPTIQDSSLSDAEGQTYSYQQGHYQKVGEVVTVQIYVTLSSKGTMTAGDQVYIAGLPFLPNRTSGCHVAYANNLSIASGSGPITGVIGFSLTEAAIRLYLWDSTSGVGWCQIQDIGATTTFVLSATYTTDS